MKKGFTNLESATTALSVYTFLKFERPFIVATDAFSMALDVVLSQSWKE